jgi:hypothetical protein
MLLLSTLERETADRCEHDAFAVASMGAWWVFSVDGWYSLYIYNSVSKLTYRCINLV